jgi:hypothetical protein
VILWDKDKPAVIKKNGGKVITNKPTKLQEQIGSPEEETLSRSHMLPQSYD